MSHRDILSIVGCDISNAGCCCLLLLSLLLSRSLSRSLLLRIVRNDRHSAVTVAAVTTIICRDQVVHPVSVRSGGPDADSERGDPHDIKRTRERLVCYCRPLQLVFTGLEYPPVFTARNTLLPRDCFAELLELK